MNTKTLVLDKSYIPIEVYDWQQAVTALYSKDSEVVSSYDYIVRSPSIEMRIPSVLRLKNTRANFSRLGLVRPLNRNTLYDEYNGICIWCGRHLSRSDMTIEHIIPRAAGGLTDWTNCAPSCSPCNLRKGSQDWRKMGLSPKYLPKVPRTSKLVPKNLLLKIGGSIPSEDWRPWIYWEVEERGN